LLPYAEFHYIAINASRQRSTASVQNLTASAHSDSKQVKEISPATRQSSTRSTSESTELSITALRTVHTCLIRAEQAKRQNDRVSESEAYNELGMYFERAGYLPLAAYHYQRCLDIAEAMNWAEGRMAAHMAMGLGVTSPEERIAGRSVDP
jgi:hypothetical protein